MISILQTEVAKCNINDLVRNLTIDSYPEKIVYACTPIFPVHNVTIRKVKVLKRPKIDIVKLNEMYSHEKKAVAGGAGKVDEDEGAENLLKK